MKKLTSTISAIFLGAILAFCIFGLDNLNYRLTKIENFVQLEEIEL